MGNVDTHMNYELRSELAVALRTNNLNRIIDMLNHNMKSEYHDDGFGEYALIGAAHYGKLGILKWMIHNTNYPLNRHVLEEATKNGHLGVIKWLIKNTYLRANVSIIAQAVERGHLNILKWFLEDASRVEGQLPSMGYLMYLAVENGHLNIVKYLYENGANVTMELIQDAKDVGEIDIARYLAGKKLSKSVSKLYKSRDFRSRSRHRSSMRKVHDELSFVPIHGKKYKELKSKYPSGLGFNLR